MPDETLGHEQIRKTVTVVFCDVSGSTTLGERLDTASLERVLSDYTHRMRRVLEHHGATVERFLGDAIVGVFGLPQLHEDDAWRAVRAAVEMRDEVSALNEVLQSEWGVPIAVRTGLNTGTVITGASAGSRAIITGEAVSLAIRFGQAAYPGEIILGESTYRMVKGQVTVEPVPLVVLEGQREPVRPVRLMGVLPGSDPRLSSPMVGRDREQNLLHDAFERVVRDRVCHLFTVRGSAGVGKSRLAYEFTSTVKERATVLFGRCLPYGEGVALWPLVSVIRQVAALTEDDQLEVVQAKLVSAMNGQERAVLIAERVAAMLGMRQVVGASEEHFWAVRKLLEAVARRRPLVVVFDDLHWGEPTFLDLVEHLAESSREAAILVVCIARPELIERRPHWGGGKLSNATSITLEPLTETESRHLMANLLGEEDLAAETWARAGEKAEGNPLFVEEVLAMLIDDGLLRRDGEHWAPTADLTHVAIPPTIHALLSTRLEQLDPGERAVIERAAVIGKVFYLGAVSHLLPDGDPQPLRNHLKGLIGKDLVRPVSSDFGDEETYRFRHILIRDTAYEGLSKALRAEFHERLANWLERYAGDRIKQYEEILAYHLEQACRYRDELGLVDERSRRLARRAVERLVRGAHRADVRGDMPAAAALFQRARQLMPEDDPMRVDLSIRLGHALVKVGSLEEASTVLDDALSRAATLGDQGLLAHALIEHTSARISTGTDASLRTALGEAEQAIVLFEKLNDDQGLSTAWSLVAEIHNIHGRFAASREALECALVHARSIGDEREVAWAIWGIVGSMAHGPTPAEEVVRFAGEQLEWARVEGHRWVEAGALMHLGQAQAIRGHFEEARGLVAQSRATYNDLGLGLFAAALSQISGWVEWYAGELTGAEAELRRGYEALEAFKEKGYLSTVAAQLAEVLYAQGRDEEAERYTRTSEAAASKEDLVTQMLWRGTRAKIRARRGAPVEAEQLAREAVALAERTDMLNMRGQVVVDLAEVLLLAGPSEEAIGHLEEAVRLYTRKGNLVALRETRARLDELRKGVPPIREDQRSDDSA